MVKLNLYSKVLLGLFVSGLYIASACATEKDKEDTTGKPTTTTQSPSTRRAAGRQLREARLQALESIFAAVPAQKF